MTPESRKTLITAIIVITAVAATMTVLWQSHNADIKAKLDYQEKYPFSCAVNNDLWDSCTTPASDGNGVSFKSNATCINLYYFVTNWQNHVIMTYDGDGLVHYTGSGYDSNGVYHESSNYIQCPQRGFA